MKHNFSEAFQGRIARLLYQDENFAEQAVGILKPTFFENPVAAWSVKVLREAHLTHGHHPSQMYLEHEYRKAAKMGSIRKEEQVVYEKFIKRVTKPVPEREYVKKELGDFLQHQSIKRFLLNSVDDYLPKRNWDEIKKQMLNIVDFSVTGDSTLGLRPGDTFKRRIKKREKHEMDGITSGLVELDRLMIRGGLTAGQLASCIAPTGRGKTNWLINCAASAVMDGIPTVYYSLELDEEDIATRMDARFTDVPLNLLRTNPNDVRRGWKKVASRVSKNLIVKHWPTGSASVSDMKSHLRSLGRVGFYPKLIIIDYLDLMQPRIVREKDSTYETQGQTSIDVRGLMGEVKAACWTATQGNRASMDPENDGDVDLHHMADSVKKAFVADVVVGIAQGPKEVKQGRARLAVLKNRNGPAWRELKMRVDHSRSLFRPLI